MGLIERVLHPDAAKEKAEADATAARVLRSEQYQQKLEQLSPEQQEEIERVVKRGRRGLRNLTNIRDHNDDVLALRKHQFFLKRSDPDNFFDDVEQKFPQISKILCGVGLSIAAITIPHAPFEYLLGGAAAFCGAGLAWYHALEWRQHLQPVSRKKIQTYRSKKFQENGGAPPEEGFVSERNLRAGLLDSQDSIIAQRKDLRDKLREFKTFVIERADTSDPALLSIELDKLVLAYDTIFNKTKTAQEHFLTRAPECEGLASLLEEKRRWLGVGFGAATALLVGGKGLVWPPPGLEDFSESMKGYTSLFIGEHSQRAERSMAGFVGTGLSILAGATARFVHRKKHDEATARQALKNALLLGEGEFKKLQRRKAENYIEALEIAGEAHSDGGDAGEELPPTQAQTKELFKQLLDQARKEWEAIAHTPRSVGDIDEILESFPPTAPIGSLDDISSPPEEAVPPARPKVPEQPSPRIAPLSAYEITHRPRREVVGNVITAIYRIAGRDEADIQQVHKELPAIPPIDVLERVLPGAMRSIAQDPNVTEKELDETLKYAGILQGNMTDSIAGFVFVKPEDKEARTKMDEIQELIDIIDKEKSIKDARGRERRRQASGLFNVSPEAFRFFFLQRYSLAEIERGQAITEDFFEQSLREWSRNKPRNDYECTSLKDFLLLCKGELTSRSVVGRREKEHTIQQGILILNEGTPASRVSLPPDSGAESLTAMRQGMLMPLAAAFESVCQDPHYDRGAVMAQIRRGTEQEGVPSQDQRYPYISSVSMREIDYSEYSRPLIEHGMMEVDPRCIIGSHIRGRDITRRTAWIMHGADQESCESLASRLIDRPTAETFDEILFEHDSPLPHIKLLMFCPHWSPAKEPLDPIFFVTEGIPYVATAKVANVPRILAQVIELRSPTSRDPIHPRTLNYDIFSQWALLTNGKFLDSDIRGTEVDIKNGQYGVGTMRNALHPWLPFFSLETTALIYQRFEQLYPRSLDNVHTLDGKNIVKNVLFTPQTLRKYLGNLSKTG